MAKTKVANGIPICDMGSSVKTKYLAVPVGLVVRIWRFHRHGRGSIPRLGEDFHENKIS